MATHDELSREFDEYDAFMDALEKGALTATDSVTFRGLGQLMADKLNEAAGVFNVRPQTIAVHVLHAVIDRGEGR